jgi:hypothetical protein
LSFLQMAIIEHDGAAHGAMAITESERCPIS